MEALFRSASRQSRHLSSTSKLSRSATRNSYSHSATPQVCLACRVRGQKRGIKDFSIRRGISGAASSERTGQIEKPFENTAVPKTHYDLFPNTLPSGPPPNGPFHIDVRQLRNEFLRLQAVAHPDRHPQERKSRAEATSARINEAYKTLQNPLLRAQYLLSLRGINVAEDETAKVEDPALLMEVLETREQIEEAESDAEIEQMKALNDERIEESEGILDDAFRRDDMETAKVESVKMRYWINIKEGLDHWEPGKPVVLMH